jgi:hypothetical protein
MRACGVVAFSPTSGVFASIRDGPRAEGSVELGAMVFLATAAATPLNCAGMRWLSVRSTSSTGEPEEFRGADSGVDYS